LQDHCSEGFKNVIGNVVFCNQGNMFELQIINRKSTNVRKEKKATRNLNH